MCSATFNVKQTSRKRPQFLFKFYFVIMLKHAVQAKNLFPLVLWGVSDLLFYVG